MKLKYFAWIKERLSVSEETLDVDGIEIENLINLLQQKGATYFEVFSKPEKICIAINNELVVLNQNPQLLVSKNDEVAFFPPISGG